MNAGLLVLVRGLLWNQSPLPFLRLASCLCRISSYHTCSHHDVTQRQPLTRGQSKAFAVSWISSLRMWEIINPDSVVVWRGDGKKASQVRLLPGSYPCPLTIHALPIDLYFSYSLNNIIASSLGRPVSLGTTPDLMAVFLRLPLLLVYTKYLIDLCWKGRYHHYFLNITFHGHTILYFNDIP